MNDQHLNRLANSTSKAVLVNGRVTVQGLWSIMVPSQMEYASYADYGSWPEVEGEHIITIQRPSTIHVVNGKIGYGADTVSHRENSIPTVLNCVALLAGRPTIPEEDISDLFPKLVIDSDLIEVRMTNTVRTESETVAFSVTRKGAIDWNWIGAIRIAEDFLPYGLTIAENWLKTILPVTNEELMEMPDGEGYVKDIPFSFKKGMSHITPEGIVLPIPDSCHDLTENGPVSLPDGTIAFSTEAAPHTPEEIASAQLSLISGKFNFTAADFEAKYGNRDKAFFAFVLLAQLPNFSANTYPLCVYRSPQGVVVSQIWKADNANRIFAEGVVVPESGLCRYVTLRCNFPDAYDWLNNAVDIEGGEALLLQWMSRIRFVGDTHATVEKSSVKATSKSVQSVETDKKTVQRKKSGDDGLSFRKLSAADIDASGTLLSCREGGAIELPDGIKKIGKHCFLNARTLVAVKIPEGVEEIEEGAFACSESLEYVSLPSTLKQIGESAFYESKALKKIIIPEGIEELNACVFCDCHHLQDISLPSTLKKVGNFAFSDCINLKEINIPEGVEEIGQCAFNGCTKLAHITLPTTLKAIGGGAFNDAGLKRLEIPEGVEKIETTEYGCFPFQNCKKLEFVSWPPTQKRIGEGMFQGCKNLKEINIPEGVEEIGGKMSHGAFENCEKLESVTLPSTLKKIEEYAFSRCKGLKQINVPQGVGEIGKSAFYDCDSLGEITYEGTKAQWKAVKCASFIFSYTDKKKVRCLDGTLKKS